MIEKIFVIISFSLSTWYGPSASYSGYGIFYTREECEKHLIRIHEAFLDTLVTTEIIPSEHTDGIYRRHINSAYDIDYHQRCVEIESHMLNRLGKD